MPTIYVLVIGVINQFSCHRSGIDPIKSPLFSKLNPHFLWGTPLYNAMIEWIPTWVAPTTGHMAIHLPLGEQFNKHDYVWITPKKSDLSETFGEKKSHPTPIAERDQWLRKA